MPVYTFFPRKPDGSSPGFQAFELENDHRAAERAAVMLNQHRSGASVEVWAEDRPVLVLERRAAPGAA